MSKTAIYFAFLTAILVVAQAVIFNNLVLFNCAIAYVFIYTIIALPPATPVNLVLTVGFITGLSVDIFSDTYGINTVACTILAFIRRPIFAMYVPHDDELGPKPLSQSTVPPGAFFKYAFTLIVIYSILANVLEAFSFINIWRLLLRIAATAIYTSVALYAIDTLSVPRHAKKL